MNSNKQKQAGRQAGKEWAAKAYPKKLEELVAEAKKDGADYNQIFWTYADASGVPSKDYITGFVQGAKKGYEHVVKEASRESNRLNKVGYHAGGFWYVYNAKGGCPGEWQYLLPFVEDGNATGKDIWDAIGIEFSGKEVGEYHFACAMSSNYWEHPYLADGDQLTDEFARGFVRALVSLDREAMEFYEGCLDEEDEDDTDVDELDDDDDNSDIEEAGNDAGHRWYMDAANDDASDRLADIPQDYLDEMEAHEIFAVMYPDQAEDEQKASAFWDSHLPEGADFDSTDYCFVRGFVHGLGRDYTEEELEEQRKANEAAKAADAERAEQERLKTEEWARQTVAVGGTVTMRGSVCEIRAADNKVITSCTTHHSELGELVAAGKLVDAHEWLEKNEHVGNGRFRAMMKAIAQAA